MALSDIEYNYWLTAEYDWTDENSPDSETGSEIRWCVSSPRFDHEPVSVGTPDANAVFMDGNNSGSHKMRRYSIPHKKISVSPRGPDYGIAYVDPAGSVWVANSAVSYLCKGVEGLSSSSFPGEDWDESKHFAENKFYKTTIDLPDIISISLGESHILILTSDCLNAGCGATLWAMGYNVVDQNAEIVRSEVSENIRRDFNLWGEPNDNSRKHPYAVTSGMLGTGTEADASDAPVQIDTGVKEMVAGQNHSIYLKLDSSIMGMGWIGQQDPKAMGHAGLMGICPTLPFKTTDPDNLRKLSPFVIVPSPSELSPGFYHGPKAVRLSDSPEGTLFIKSDGSVWTFGTNLGWITPCKENHQMLVSYNVPPTPYNQDFHDSQPPAYSDYWDGDPIRPCPNCTDDMFIRESEPVGNRKAGIILDPQQANCKWDMTDVTCGTLGQYSWSEGDTTPICLFPWEKELGKICGPKFQSSAWRGWGTDVCHEMSEPFNTYYQCGDRPDAQGQNKCTQTSVNCEPSYQWKRKSKWGKTSVRQIVEPDFDNPVVDVFCLYGLVGFFIRKDGSVWGMGENTTGQLGIGTQDITSDDLSPAYRMKDAESVSPDGDPLRYNPSGPVYMDPVEISQFKGKVRQIVTNDFDGYTLFLLNDGTVWMCGMDKVWEGNGPGGLPNNTTVSAPRKIESLDDVKWIWTGGALGQTKGSIVFVREDDSMWVMGSTQSLGDSSGTQSTDGPLLAIPRSSGDDCEIVEEFNDQKVIPPAGSDYSFSGGQRWKYCIRPWDGHDMFGNNAYGWKKCSDWITIPVHCEVSDWIGGNQSTNPAERGWGDCQDLDGNSVECGEGEQIRRREIVIQSALGGDECSEDILVERRICNGPPCPTDCIPKAWSTAEWSPCMKDGKEVLCKGVTGTRTKTREVDVAATNGGLCEDLTREESCEGTLDCCDRCVPETDPIVAMHDKGWIESWSSSQIVFGKGNAGPTNRPMSPFPGDFGRHTDINDPTCLSCYCDETTSHPYNASGPTSSLPYARHWQDYSTCGADSIECGSKTIGGIGFLGKCWIHGYSSSSQTTADTNWGCRHYRTPLEYDIAYNFDRPVNISRMEIDIAVEHNMGMVASSIPSSNLKQMKWRILGDMVPVNGSYPDGYLHTQSGNYNIEGNGSVEDQTRSSIGWYGGGNRSVKLASGSGPEVLNLVASSGDGMMNKLKGSRVWSTSGMQSDYWSDKTSFDDWYGTDTLPSEFRKSWEPIRELHKPTWWDKPQWGNVERWAQFQGYAPGNTVYNVPWHVNRITIKFYWDGHVEDAWLVGVSKFKAWGIESCSDGDAFFEFPTKCNK